MENTLVTAHELFLLCKLRGKEVFAQNLESYSWTWNHAMYFFRATGQMVDLKNHTTKDKPFIKEASSHCRIKEPKLRRFTISSSCGATCLIDGKSFPWYQEQIPDDFDCSLWIYPGTFSLTVPMRDDEIKKIKPEVLLTV